MGISAELEAGRLIDATGGYGEVVGYQLDLSEHAQGDGKADDCHRFANIVDELAIQTGVRMATPDSLTLVQDFMNALARRFTEYSRASYLTAGLAQIGLGNDSHQGLEFGSTGFAMAYFEEDYLISGQWVRANQVRHAVGGLVAGYVRGEKSALAQLNARENSSDLQHGVPDLNLNSKTVPYGSKIADPSAGYSYAKHLGTWIRETLCQHYGD